MFRYTSAVKVPNNMLHQMFIFEGVEYGPYIDVHFCHSYNDNYAYLEHYSNEMNTQAG